MTKIIALNGKCGHVPEIYKNEESHAIINLIIEMTEILQLIEKSLETTRTYATKDLNCRR